MSSRSMMSYDDLKMKKNRAMFVKPLKYTEVIKSFSALFSRKQENPLNGQ